MSPGGAAALVVTGGVLKGHRYDLTGDAFVIGREQHCDLLIDDATVSRKHALLQRIEEKWFISDTSKNGTHVNSRRVTGALALANGDKIAISTAAQLYFAGPEDTVPLLLEEGQAIGRMHIDLKTHEVRLRGQLLDPALSLAQYRLLEFLYLSGDVIRTRDEVSRAVWTEADQAGITEQMIDALVKRLRDRLGQLDDGHDYILTVRGHGFRFSNPQL